ncbi:FAD:protein FMN transferase [Aestuariibacter halophilus]|uniref:FAD:protein FMN transferase n=1 Tax=Fluctibacter halophilus TaxID=226011 RepID=A0ABS8GB60_9ALTE|nr:FAD:protein FMN transferase [Aestuariibacter halophilus]MCC2617743.1 FAD:protein FMN transferase [Aestuariibacter halophilus]
MNSSCAPHNDEPVRRVQPLLGTFVEIGLWSNRMSRSALLEISRHAFARIRVVQDRLSAHNRDSELGFLNRHPGQWIPLSQDARRVLSLARSMGRLSQDRFNCTVGGALVLRGALPDLGGPLSLPSGTWTDIDIDGNRARLLRPVRVTLDGIAKGYAVDCGIAELKRYGVDGGWINAGGDVRHFGAQSLSVMVDSPRLRRGGLTLCNAAVASSQIRYAPREGHPATYVGEAKEQALLSVKSPFAWRADAMTKVLAAYPPEQRSAVAAAFNSEYL